jgi:hypothetical protein
MIVHGGSGQLPAGASNAFQEDEEEEARGKKISAIPSD